MSCEAIRTNEQMQCAKCGLFWDHDDPDPPKCMTPHQIAMKKLRSKDD